MSDSTPRIYCDANPIIELGKLARKVHDPARERDLWFLSQMLKAADNAELELYTSSISLAECVTVEGVYDKDVQEFYTGVLSSGRMFRLVQDSIFVAEQARDLRWKHGISLGGADAIHVASAIEAGCTELISWDAGMGNSPKKVAKVEALAKLGISVILPSQTKLLPSFYMTEPRAVLADEDPPPFTLQ